MLVKSLKINSSKDERQLSEAKEVAYKVGFYQGTMVYGPFAGMPAEQARTLIRQQLLDSGDAFVYCEPDGLVISRSGDECVAAFLDLWYLAYGVDEHWRDETLGHLRGQDGLGFKCFGNATKYSLEKTFGWMKEWSVTVNMDWEQLCLGIHLKWWKACPILPSTWRITRSRISCIPTSTEGDPEAQELELQK